MTFAFIENRYTATYFRIIEKAKHRNIVRVVNDGYHYHHIIPKSIGGTDSPDNLVALTYKEHRVCHCLLIKMFSNTNEIIKMRHAYGFFNKCSVFNGPRYKTGKDNIFSTPTLIAMVKKRMKEQNPMKDPAQRKRMQLANNNPFSRGVTVEGKQFPSLNAAARAFDTTPHLLKRDFDVEFEPIACDAVRIVNRRDRFVTPLGNFKTKKEIIRDIKIPEWTLDTIYDNLDSLPTSKGRGSKKLDHLSIDYSKTWRQNGFDLISVP